MSDSVQRHRWQPIRLPRRWDSPGKNTGVGCHFLLQCMKVNSESEVAQSCATLSDPMDCSLPGSSAHGIFQARVLEWGAIAFSKMWYRRVVKEVTPTQFEFNLNTMYPSPALTNCKCMLCVFTTIKKEIVCTASRESTIVACNN